MKVRLQYGTDGLDVELPDDGTTVLEPRFVPGLADEEAAFQNAVRNPIQSAPLRDIIQPSDTVALVIPDNTRPFPGERILPWLFRELAHVPAVKFTLIVGTGSHRACTAAEIAALVSPAVAGRYTIINHDATDAASMRPVGRTADGRMIRLNSDYVDADKRILLGFVEPHFFAGFSGGYKAILPGIADLDSILHYHRAPVVGHPRSTWAELLDNPTQEQIRLAGARAPADFCINVTLNRDRRITGLFCGDVRSAHDQACAFVKTSAMIPCPHPFPIVITTNGGHPLDQNLYQSVKGMSAAAQIVAPDGLIIAAARCADGFPEHGNFRRLLLEHGSPDARLAAVQAPGFCMLDQWQIQKLALIQKQARVALHSAMPDADVARAGFEPVSDLAARVAAERARRGGDAPIAVLPEGPMTVPYLQPNPEGNP